MNILLWILQAALALHTAMGAVWKFSNSVPSLAAIPTGVWRAMGVAEALVAVCLAAPAFSKNLGLLAPVAAAFIVVEMLVFCILHLSSGSKEHGQMIYWAVVAALSAFIAYGRLVIVPF